MIINFFLDRTLIKSKNNYRNIFLCPLKKSDCVNSIDIIDDIVLYGTIMGNVYLCRVNKNNLYQKKNQTKYSKKKKSNNNTFEISNSRFSKKNETQNEMKYKYKLEEKESSKISCIKLDINDNNNPNIINDYDKKEKMFYDSEAAIDTKDGIDNYKNHEISTKRKLLNAIENNNNNNIDKSMNDKNSINELIPFPQVTQLISNANENIPCVTFDTKDKINICIGDYEIISLDNMSTFNIDDENSNYNYCRIRNYIYEEEHIIECENAICMMTDKNFLIVYIKFGENTSPIIKDNIRYENKMMTSFDIIKGEIEMSNYSVPFDFDGDRFLFVDYESETVRRICIYYTATKLPPYIFKINNQFGHINYMKLLLNDKIVLCKNQRYCEIHLIDTNFTLIESWEHNGNEIIAMNLYIEGTKDTDEYIGDLNTNISIKKYNDNNLKNNEVNYKKNNSQKNNNKYNYIDINSRNNHFKRKHFEKDNNSNSSFRELRNKKINKKKVKSNKEDNILSDNDNPDINDGNNKFENENKIEIYNKYKTPSLKEIKISNNINKIKLVKRNNQNNINNHFHLSAKELKTRNKSVLNYIQDKNNSTERSFFQNEKKIYIITVDLNGNINLYHNKKRKTVFNLYNINNIEDKYKEKDFFSLGFPYYVIMNRKYYAISTDHGIFVLSNKV